MILKAIFVGYSPEYTRIESLLYFSLFLLGLTLDTGDATFFRFFEAAYGGQNSSALLGGLMEPILRDYPRGVTHAPPFL